MCRCKIFIGILHKEEASHNTSFYHVGKKNNRSIHRSILKRNGCEPLDFTGYLGLCMTDSDSVISRFESL